MSALNGKTVGALASATMLAVAGAASVMPAVAQANDCVAESAVVQQGQLAETQGEVSAPIVEGVFSFTQEAVTSNKEIGAVFAKAAAVLCQTMAGEAISSAPSIAVGGDVVSSFTATVTDMAEGDGAVSYVMGCTCATNVAGGGAIANAEVEGVALESILAQAQMAGEGAR